jgi:hypothetical protein
MGDIEMVEYAKVTPKERIDLDIEDVQYKRGKKEVLTERGEKLESIKTDIKTSDAYRASEKFGAQASGTGKSAVSKFMEWNRSRKAKATASPAPQVSGQAAPKKKIAYINGKPVIVDAKESAPRAPRAPSAKPYSAPYQPAQYAAQIQTQRTTPDIAGGMHQLPNIAGQHGIANTPRIISNNTSNLPKIIGVARSGSNFMGSIGTGGSVMGQLGHTAGSGNSFEKLSHVGTTGASLGKLQLKGKGRFF